MRMTVHVDVQRTWSIRNQLIRLVYMLWGGISSVNSMQGEDFEFQDDTKRSRLKIINGDNRFMSR